MKFGVRKPSLKRSIKARTTGRVKRAVKSSVNPLYGKKGMGLINNPKKAVYNKVYNKTTFSALPSLNLSNKKSSNRNKSQSDKQLVSNYYKLNNDGNKLIKNVSKLQRDLKYSKISRILYPILSIFGFTNLFGWFSVPFAFIAVIIAIFAHTRVKKLDTILKEFDDEVKLSDDAKNATDTRPNEAIPFSFEIRSWNEYMDNISKWQKENARDQWVDAKYSNKPLYQYSRMNCDNKTVRLVAEPQNEYDKYAIGVYLDNYKIGYIPRPINEENYNKLLENKEIEADVHGGNSKYIDEYGDLIVDKGDPKVKLTILE